MSVKDEEVNLKPDDLLEEEQVDQEEQTEEENPSFQFEDDEGFEIISEDEQVEEEDTGQNKQLQEQLEQMKQQFQMMQQMQSSGSTQSEQQGQLAKVLQQMQENLSKKDESANKNPQIDWKKKRSEWMDQFFDKPLDTLEDYTNTTIAPAFMEMQNELKSLKQQLSRQTVASDPQFKKIMDKYPDEVDSWAKSFKDDPDAYKKAASMVGMNHFSELLEEEKKAALEAQEEEKPKKKQVSYTGTERQPNPQKKQKKRIVLNPSEKREFERQFALSPLPDKKTFYEMKWLPSRKK